MPIKCPVAPLEFLFLADSYFRRLGRRDQRGDSIGPSLPGAFTKPKATEILGGLLAREEYLLSPRNSVWPRIDNENKKLVGWDETEVPYDLLVSIPTNWATNASRAAGWATS